MPKLVSIYFILSSPGNFMRRLPNHSNFDVENNCDQIITCFYLITKNPEEAKEIAREFSHAYDGSIFLMEEETNKMIGKMSDVLLSAFGSTISMTGRIIKQEVS